MYSIDRITTHEAIRQLYKALSVIKSEIGKPFIKLLDKIVPFKNNEKLIKELYSLVIKTDRKYINRSLDFCKNDLCFSTKEAIRFIHDLIIKGIRPKIILEVLHKLENIKRFF